MAKHDDQVKALMAKVAEKKAALGPKPKAVLITNGVFKFDSSNHVNINTLTDMDSLLRVYASALSQHRCLVNAAHDLEVPLPNIVISGYAIEDWKTDLKHKADVIQWQAQERELMTFTKKLESLVSEDLKTENELASLTELLK